MFLNIYMQLHFIIIFVLTFEWFKQTSGIFLDQQGTALYAHDFVDGPTKLKVMFDDSDETIVDNGILYIYADCIFGLAPKGFDAQVLFNPFEGFMRSFT